jgi:DNA polymerase III alpha subunit
MLISEAESIDVSRKDSRNKNLMLEKDLIGVEFSMIFDKGKRAKLTCKECYKFSKENRGHKGSVLVKISEVIPLVTKRGQNAGSEMCQIIATDNSGSYRFACFPDNYKKFKDLIEENVDCVIEVDGTGNGWCVNSLNHV